MLQKTDKGHIRSYRVVDSLHGWVDVSVEVGRTNRTDWYIAYTAPDAKDASDWVTEHIIPNLKQ